MAEIDWAMLETEYATTSISYRKLAAKHGISFNTLKDHAVQGKWTDARKRYNKKRAKLTQQKMAAKEASVCAKQLRRVAKSAETATIMIERMMADAEQFKRHIITEGLGRGATAVEERIYEKYDTKALKEFTGALKDLVTVIRNVNNLPTVQEQSAMDIAIERLRLEEQKVNANDEDKDETGVVVIAPVLEDEDDVDSSSNE
ncbi:MAG: hypothetical protein ACOYU3_07370 [Bacillota bacterium]